MDKILLITLIIISLLSICSFVYILVKIRSECFKYFSNKQKLINTKSNKLTEKYIPFLKNFISNLKLNISLEELNINHSQSLVFEDIFIRKETWSHNINTDKIKLFIDCLYDDKLKQKLKNRYYHVTWGAISYYIRNVDKKIMLQPLKDIYNKKNKFCDYMFKNKTYRNGVKRY